MSLNVYLTFDGNCREAFEFYRSVFGGEFQAFSTFAEGPDDMGVPDENKDDVMHVSLRVGDSVLMGKRPRTVWSADRSRQQLLHLHRWPEPRTLRRVVLEAVGGRVGDHALAGDVLGFVLRHVDGPLRHQLDGELRLAG